MIDETSEILRIAAAETILPRYRALAAHDVEEKSAGEVVTIADREAEKIITAHLLRIKPGSRVIGEEACAADPSLMDNLSEGAVWLVDPLDGTANFAAGRGPFAVMTALLVDGEIVAAWMLDPVTDQMFKAERGSGAFLNGDRITTAQTSPGLSKLSGVIASRFMPPEMQASMKTKTSQFGEIKPLSFCAGADYPAVATGDRHFILYWRVLPWDHAPGALFLTEAGGHVARANGEAYHVDARIPGLLVARNHDIWCEAQAGLFPL